MLWTLYSYHCAVHAWFDIFVFNTVNDILGKPKYKPSMLRLIYGTETAEYIRKKFNENGNEESNKYEYLLKTINDPKYPDTFHQICANHNIKNTRLFKNFIEGKAKKQKSIIEKKNEYLKVIKRGQKKYEKEMWEGYKLKSEFEYD